jgi:hypothetical protein
VSWTLVTATETCSCGASTTQQAGMSSTLAIHLAEFRAAHAGCRIPPGPCMEMLPAFRGEGPTAQCTLLHGHKGAHTDGQASWTALPPGVSRGAEPAPGGNDG